MTRLLRVGVVQGSPPIFDLAQAISTTTEWIKRAASEGVQLLAFAEASIGGYPFWCDLGNFARWDNHASKILHRRLLQNSLVLPSEELTQLCDAVRRSRITVVLGCNERLLNRGSLYNALITIDSSGCVIGHHRKLVLTGGERLVWTPGDAAGLRTHSVLGAQLGGLICWEHWMPLARQVLHSAGESIHVAAWPHTNEQHQIASRHYALEGRCFVLAAANYLTKAHLPGDLQLPDSNESLGDTLLAGGSSIIGPDGHFIVQPAIGGEHLLTAEIDLDRVDEERQALDVGGHYARPDLFTLSVRHQRLDPAPTESHDATP
ncbi:MAG: carbon-nitrogen hydrolase family protein [Myxococcota bacterium]